MSNTNVFPQDLLSLGLGAIRTPPIDGMKSEGEPLGLGLGKSLWGSLTAPSLTQRNAALQLCLENTHTHRAEADRLGFATDLAICAVGELQDPWKGR